jgi:hypothetical protein
MNIATISTQLSAVSSNLPTISSQFAAFQPINVSSLRCGYPTRNANNSQN